MSKNTGVKTDKPVTIFSSNSPINCYILKGRLDTEGIEAYIFDEFIVWVHPFMAVAIGGVKLKTKLSQAGTAVKIIDSLNSKKLLDSEGKYALDLTLQTEFSRQNEILKLKSRIRNNPGLLNQNTGEWTRPDFITEKDMERIIREEVAFQRIQKLKFRFSWSTFLYEFLDPNGRLSRYLRPLPPEYYIEKEIVEKFDGDTDYDDSITCPVCHSKNVGHGMAMDIKWDVLYLILSLFIFAPFPPIRRKNHCFNCGNDFK